MGRKRQGGDRRRQQCENGHWYDGTCRYCAAQAVAESWGKDNHALRRRVRRYATTVSDVGGIYIFQGRACAICRASAPLDDLVIDHDHETDAVRGLLCRKCNLAIGLIDDDAESARRAAAYLKHPPSSKIQRLA